MTKTDLERIFTYHPPFGSQQARYIELRKYALLFALHIEELCPPSREKSLAITRIQEACQMANASIAVNEENLDGREGTTQWSGTTLAGSE